MKEAKQFKSKTTGESCKIIQRIDCNSKDVIYLVIMKCKKCGKQGIGSTEDFKSKISNCISHVIKKRPTCKMVQHFYLMEGHFIKDFKVTGIAKLLNPPRNPEKKSERLGNFEDYWQIKLMTLEPYDLYNREECFRTRSAEKQEHFLRY